MEEIEMQENKIGETFVYKGRRLVVKVGSGFYDCDKCAFCDDTRGCRSFNCLPRSRHDGKSVYFEEVEMKEEEMRENKIGETFEYKGKVFIVRKSTLYGCFKCAFDEDYKDCHSFRCTPGGRKDGKFVHFEEVKPEEVKKRAVKAKKSKTKEVKTKKAKPKEVKTKKAKTKEVKNG